MCLTIPSNTSSQPVNFRQNITMQRRSFTSMPNTFSHGTMLRHR